MTGSERIDFKRFCQQVPFEPAKNEFNPVESSAAELTRYGCDRQCILGWDNGQVVRIQTRFQHALRSHPAATFGVGRDGGNYSPYPRVIGVRISNRNHRIAGKQRTQNQTKPLCCWKIKSP
jgi:hypothetical protein